MPGPGGDEAAREQGLTRRAVLRDGSAVALALFFLGDGSSMAQIALPGPSKGGAGAFLNAEEMGTLRGAVDRFVPGRPEDADEGAVAAGCTEAIDALLAAFAVDPPRIYAGGPFSDRAGSATNHFARFVALDPYEAKAWRLRIEGSRGRPELEFNGPVKGWQAVYREGLAALERAAGPAGFATLPGPARDLILRNEDDPAIGAFVDVAFPHTLQLMYGAPEYGGNRDLVGWRNTGYAGDVQPRGWTREEVEAPPSDLDAAAARSAPGLDELLRIAPLASAEVAHGILVRSGDSLAQLRADVEPLVKGARRRRNDGG